MAAEQNHHKTTKREEELAKEIVDDVIVCELKAVDTFNPVWKAQLISHLRLTEKHLGFLINFNVPLIKDGIHRFII